MQNLRRHTVLPDQPFEFHIAADARISKTDYCDDQVWVARIGSRDEAAIAFQTQYGGRAGLVSLVPMWRIDDRVIYQAQSYARRPAITAFAPNFIQIEAALLPDLELVARFLAMESRAAGGEFALRNLGVEALDLQLDLFGHVVINARNQTLNVLTMADYSLALHLGEIGNLNPVAVLEGASIEIYGGRISSPKLGCRISLAPGAEVRIPFVAAGLADMRDSFSVAMNWLSRPWDKSFDQIDRLAATIPKISTGSSEWNLLIDLSYAQLVKSFLNPTAHLPHQSLVANRASNRGWSRSGDGTDHPRAWSGQDPTLAYLAVSAIANSDSEMAKSIIRNYLHVQDETGHIDRQPGLAGQRQGVLMMPILARLSLKIVAQTDDQDFAAEVLPALVAFFGRWLEADADDDGVPEWQSERQLGYIALPTFGRGQAWAQGADIRQMETPDLLAYLISEADALAQMATLVRDEAIAEVVTEKLKGLEERLEEFWDGTRYAYRDRDSHFTSDGRQLLQRGAGDQIHQIGEELATPARLMIRVVGGVSQRPRITLHLEGKNEGGDNCTIEASVDDFLWQNRQGVYTTKVPLSQVERIAVKGLSRVYKVYAQTIDSSKVDINGLLPLWTGRLTLQRAAKLVELALDEAHFLRPNGLTMVSASDRNYDPSNARGGGGIWMYWLTLICEGMLKAGFRAEATEILKRVLDMLARVLAREGKLSRFYHADEAKGFGEDHHIGGIVPVSLLNDVIGIRIVAADKVWVGDAFTWGDPISVEQHGVIVRRSSDEIQIDFPSGHSETLPADTPWRLVQDPMPLPLSTEAEEIEILDMPEVELPSEQDDDEPLTIEVEDYSDSVEGSSPAAPDHEPPADDDTDKT